MPITWLDLILLLVMLMSGLLAMIRGFMREVLSIARLGHRRAGHALFLCARAADRAALFRQQHGGDRASPWSAYSW